MANHSDEKPLRELFSDLSTTLNSTMGEIKERLSTEHFKGRASEAAVDRAKKVYDAAAARTAELGSQLAELGSQLKENVKRNPWPYALAGTGAAAGIGGAVYFLSKRKGNHEETTESYDPCAFA